jgi:hypothetical protein
MNDQQESEEVDSARHSAAFKELNVLGAVLTLGIHVVLCIPLLLLRIRLSRFEQVFRDFNMKLPTLTEWILSGGLNLLLLITAAVLITDVPAFLLLRGKRRTVWTLFSTIAPLTFAVLGGFALMTPMFRMMNLSK